MSVTSEARLGDLGVDGVVLAGDAGDGGLNGRKIEIFSSNIFYKYFHLEHGEGVGGVAGGGVEVAVAGLGVGVQRSLLLVGKLKYFHRIFINIFTWRPWRWPWPWA